MSCEIATYNTHNCNDEENVYIAQPAPKYPTCDGDRIDPANASSYSYDLPWMFGDDTPQISAEITPSVVDPESWVSFNYPRTSTLSGQNFTSTGIDPCAPRRAIFPSTAQTINQENSPIFRQPRSQHNAYQNEDHPYFYAANATVISGEPIHNSRLSVTNPDLSTTTPDEIKPTCWQGFLNFITCSI